ncbi:MAG: hypothetical protein AAGG72_03250 [Pseudomonadota bacterium]
MQANKTRATPLTARSQAANILSLQAGVFRALQLTVLLGGIAFVGALTSATESRADNPCTETETASPTALLNRLRDEQKLEEVHRDASYVALQDGKTFAVWTFTQADQPAHPAVVCRVPVRDGENITVKMVINCDGPKKACEQMEADFKALNQQMQLQVNEQQKNKG